MKFYEFPLADSIYDVYVEMENKGLRPRCIDYFIYDDKRAWLADAIYSKLSKEDKKKFSYDIERFLKAWDTFGKGANNTRGASTKLVVEVARLHGCKCYYDKRLPTPCSDTVTVDRILPGERGGTYNIANCQIACSKHNISRCAKIIESILRHN